MPLPRSLAFALLLGCTAAHAEPAPNMRAGRVPVAGQRAPLALEPVLIVDEQPEGAGASAPLRLPFTWRCDDAACASASAEVESSDGALQVRLVLAHAAGDAGVGLTVEAHWRRAAWVREVALELSLPGLAATVIGRDLRPATPTPSLAWLERFDPKWIALARDGAPVATWIVDDGIDGVRVQRSEAGARVVLALDDATARPFLHDARCTSAWRAPNRHLPVPSRLRVADERVRAHVALLPGAALPLIKSHFPDGRSAALVITDHADQTSLRTLTALAYGRSDLASGTGASGGGLIGHHLVITKALFAHGDDRAQLEDPRMVALADALHAAGSEIVPHSATPHRDERAVTQAALDRFARWNARTWIDHQPETNCEAFGDQGFQAGGRFGIADLLATHAYRYVWAEIDEPAGALNLLKPARLDQRAPTVWPIGRLSLGGPSSLWMFRSQWAFLDARPFYAMYAPAQLDRLERERGLHIAHTYLETYHKRGTKFGQRNLLVPVDKRDPPGGRGAVALDARFESLLGQLQARVARGSLWIPTVGELGDRLRAVGDVTMTLAEDGSARLHTPSALAGSTWVVGAPAVQIELDGKPVRAARSDGKQTTFWVDLPAGDSTLRLRLASGAPLPIVDAPTAPRAQR